ncbi:hypothetical protein O3G_MSEX008863 [Manduca sexta]|uniref:Uncharacterized protein n=1 Tax=Manduca sexta TaxID=7130 RepID=A0A921ZCE3_MANSE|nr:hypothetical protein O3G_MSEX008863 [Manduca sexta]
MKIVCYINSVVKRMKYFVTNKRFKMKIAMILLLIAAVVIAKDKHSKPHHAKVLKHGFYCDYDAECLVLCELQCSNVGEYICLEGSCYCQMLETK